MTNLQVKLTADTQEFNRKIQQSKNQLDNLNNSAVKSAGINVNSTGINKLTGEFKNLFLQTSGFVAKLALFSPTINKIYEGIDKIKGAVNFNTTAQATGIVANNFDKIAKDMEKFKTAPTITKSIDRIFEKFSSKKFALATSQGFVNLYNTAKKVSNKVVSLPFVPKSIKNNHEIKNKIEELRIYYRSLKSMIPFMKDIQEMGFDLPIGDIIASSTDDLEDQMVRIEKRAEELYKKLPKAFSETTAKIKETIKHAASLIKKFTSLLLAGTMILGLILSVKWANQIAAINAEIDDNAQKVNMTTQQYQKWSYVMKMAGSDVSVLKTSISQLTLRIKESEKGSNDALYGFQRLGVSVYDVNGELRDTTSIFEDTVIALQKIENTTTRAAIASSIFGRNASELNGLLNMSAKDMEKLVKINNNLTLSATDAAIAISGSFEDAKDTLSSVVQSFKSTIGEIMLPLLTKLITTIIIAISYINIFIRTIFGLNLDKATGNGKATKNMNGFNNSIKNTQKSAEKLQRTIASFDELNILSKNDSEDTSSIDTDVPDLNFNTNINGTSFDFISDEQLDKIDKFRQKMKELQSTVQMCAAIGALIAGLFLIISGFMSGSVLSIINGIGLLGLGIAIGMSGEEGNTPFDKIKNALIDFKNFLLNNIGEVVAILTGIFAIVLGVLSGNVAMVAGGAALTGVAVLSMEDSNGETLFSKLLQTISKFSSDSQSLVAGLTGLFGIIALIAGVLSGNFALIATGGAMIGVSIFTALQQDSNGDSLFDKLINKAKDFVLKYQTIIAALSGLFGLIAMICGVVTFNPFLIMAGGALIGVSILTALQADENGKSLFNVIEDKLVSAWDDIKSWFTDNVAVIFTGDWWAEKFQAVKDAISDVGKWIKEKVDNFFTGIVDSISKKIDNIKNKISSIFGMSDKAQSKANNFSTRSSSSPVMQLAQLKIPALANGGIAKSPSLVEVGEYAGAKSNPEIVTPQNIMRETVSEANMEVVNAIYAIGNQITKAVDDKDMDVYMDTDKVTRKVAKRQDTIKRQQGTSLVTI